MNNTESATELLAIERDFFALIDKAKHDDFRPGKPTLVRGVKMLQRYDRLCGLDPCTDFATAIDVRIFYLVLGILKEGNPERRHELDDFFDRAQVQAFDRARLGQGLKPVALRPALRQAFRSEADARRSLDAYNIAHPRA